MRIAKKFNFLKLIKFYNKFNITHTHNIKLIFNFIISCKMVFESIAEKILSSAFGKYISNIDRRNLQVGVWNGNVLIENVGL